MCGIAGIVAGQYDASLLQERLQSMHQLMRHRGPDGEGMYVDADGSAALAQNRLAIIELSDAGRQPMSTSDGRFTIIFNGEIYNYPALRATLLDRGVALRGHSDTEVILNLFAIEGRQCVDRLNGMFALAIWDRERRSLFLARDPLGIKPMYVWQHGAALAFASEIRALLAAGFSPPRLCIDALAGLLLWGSVPEPATLIDGIRVLPAGHTALFSAGEFSTQPYWKPDCDVPPMEPDRAVAETRAVLLDSVRRHFVSDVPVSIFLSGGIDSTSILSLARQAGMSQLNTFCISFDDDAYNEGDVASQTARHFQTQHVDWRLTADQGKQLVAQFLTAIDQPTTDGFNTFCVSKLAHDHGAKVVLSGLGGDELFGSYPSFKRIPQLLAWHRRLGPARRVAASVIEAATRKPQRRRLAHFLRSDGSMLQAYWAMRGFFQPSEVQTLVRHYTDCDYQFNPKLFDDASGANRPMGDWISRLELTRYMKNQLLRDSDVMSMHWSMELRVPFVDRLVVDALGASPRQLVWLRANNCSSMQWATSRSG